MGFEKSVLNFCVCPQRGENVGELKVALEMLSRKILLSKEIEPLEP